MNAVGRHSDYQAPLIRAGRLLVSVVFAFAALDWVGWATGVAGLTRVYPSWPPMTPWTALWLAGLAVAILVHTGSPPAGRVWVGRGLAVFVGVTAVVVLMEYVTGRAFGVDTVWFGESVRVVQPTLPGRPSPPTTVSVLLLSVAVASARMDLRRSRAVWGVSLIAAMVTPFVTVLAYLFDAVAQLDFAPTTGMAFTTALSLLLLGAAVVLLQPAWLLARSDRLSLIRLGTILAGFPLLVGLSRRVFLALGLGADLALTFSVATGTVVLGAVAYRRSHREHQVGESVESDRTLLRASTESLLDPQARLEAARDSSGQIVDFLYRDVNQATCDYLGLARADLIGLGVVEAMPGIRNTLLPDYIRCLDTGEPVVLNDFSYDNEVLADTRRYDLRATRATPTSLVLTWRDVTDRYQAAQDLAAAERQYRLLAENATDVVVHVRHGTVVWVSPSVNQLLGAPDSYWVGRQIQEVSPPEDAPAFARRMATLASGGSVGERIRVVSVDGVTHWVSMRAQPFHDDAGRVDGFLTSLRVIDDEMTARQQAVEARRQQARADALYRRSVDSSAVGMCLADVEGNFVETNHALCEFFGYDAETMRRMTWQQLTHRACLEADLDNRAQVLSGDIESYRMVKQFIHADGHPIWGDLSVSCMRGVGGKVEMFIGQITDITGEVEIRAELDRARQEREREDARYRRSIENAAVGMCLVTPEGCIQQVNDAMLRLFGIDMTGMYWQDLVPEEYLEEEQDYVNGILEGRLDSYRMVKHYVHPDGHRIWVDLSGSAIRDDKGQAESLIILMIDITARMDADERNTALSQQLQQQTERIKSELDSAATYMRSIMPTGLSGEVNVASRYLPAQQLGGDCLDYYWVDDDHLLIKLIDVSGHGLEPALLAVSVHNLMRSGSIPVQTLLSPEAVLTELNRLFAMDQQSDHYFTMWYGIYETTTRTLRYASAGSPPALAFNAADGGSTSVTELSTHAAPVGMFEDTEFTSRTHHVPPGCRILIHSDGANEINLPDGGQLTLAGFKNLVYRVAASPDWSLDHLTDQLRALTPSGAFEDDCSLIQLAFD